jgi:serine/threonine protein kinase
LVFVNLLFCFFFFFSETPKKVMMSTVGGGSPEQMVGTYPYMSPELFGAGQIVGDNKASDVYAFGVMLWEILQSVPKAPWEGKPKSFVEVKVCSGVRPGPAIKDPRRAVVLIEECWGKSEYRPSFQEVVTELEWLLCESMDATERQMINDQARAEAELVKGELDDDDSSSFDRRKCAELSQRARDAVMSFVQSGGQRPSYNPVTRGLDVKAADALGKGDAGLFEARGQFRVAQLDEEWLQGLDKELSVEFQALWKELHLKRIKSCNELEFKAKGKELSASELVDEVCS